MPEIVNRIPDLLTKLEPLMTESYRATASEYIAENMGAVWRRSLEDHQPRSHPEFRTTGHRHTGIHEGWRPSSWPYVYPYQGGANVRIYNVSEHLNWQRFGIRRDGYRIPNDRSNPGSPSQKRLRFWLPTTQPLRVLQSAGWYIFNFIQHPGFGPWGGRDFVKRAMEDSEREVKEEFISSGRRFIIEPLEEFFG